MKILCNDKNKHTILMICGLAIFWLVAACNPVSAPQPAVYPSETPAVGSTPSLTPTTSPQPSATAVPTIPCFTTYNAPFAFLPGSFRMLVRAEMGVQLFDLETMQVEKFIQAPNIINGPAVALSPEDVLAWAFDDGIIQLVRLPDQALINTMQSRQTSPIKLEFSPTKGMLYSASHDGMVQFWDLQGNQRNAFTPVGDVMNIGLSPDGNMIAVIPSDGPVQLYNLDDLNLVMALGGSGGYDTSDAVFSPDGEYLAADLATRLHIWKLSDGVELLGDDNPVNSMAVTFSPDGKYLAYSNVNNIILSSPDGTVVIRTLVGHQAPIFELLFSPDSSILVSTDDIEIRVWRVEDGELLSVGKRACP